MQCIQKKSFFLLLNPYLFIGTLSHQFNARFQVALFFFSARKWNYCFSKLYDRRTEVSF